MRFRKRFTMAVIRGERWQLSSFELEKLLYIDFLLSCTNKYKPISTKILDEFVTARSWMSLIIVLIRVEFLEKSALQFWKKCCI